VSDQTLTLSRRYDAPRALVWTVWTDPDHVAAWWGPFGPEQTRCDIEATVGGLFHVAMRAPDGSEHPSKGVIREMIAGEKLVIEGDADATDACGAGLPPRAVVTVLFEDDAGGTLLTLIARFLSAEAREAATESGYVVSWRETLEALAPYLDTMADTRSAL